MTISIVHSKGIGPGQATSVNLFSLIVHHNNETAIRQFFIYYGKFWLTILVTCLKTILFLPLPGLFTLSSLFIAISSKDVRPPSLNKIS